MSRSLVTFAITLAAAMDSDSPSPFTRDSCGKPRSRAGSPSTSAMSGRVRRPANASAIARCVARKMLIRSISSGSTSATAQITSGCAVILSYRSSRRFAVSFLESSRYPGSKSRGRITAAADTGPARGPRPASSTPATRGQPPATSLSSYEKSGTRRSYHIRRFVSISLTAEELSSLPKICTEISLPSFVTIVPMPVYFHFERMLCSCCFEETQRLSK